MQCVCRCLHPGCFGVHSNRPFQRKIHANVHKVQNSDLCAFAWGGGTEHAGAERSVTLNHTFWVNSTSSDIWKGVTAGSLQLNLILTTVVLLFYMNIYADLNLIVGLLCLSHFVLGKNPVLTQRCSSVHVASRHQVNGQLCSNFR